MGSHCQTSFLGNTSSSSSASADADSLALSYGVTSAADEFDRNVLSIINNSDISDDVLRERADKHLDILGNVAFSQYNVPKWVVRLTLLEGVGKQDFTMRRLFDAMYTTASDFNLTSGARYVSASICVCAALASAEPTETRLERLAAELLKLGEIWVAYMLWPFAANRIQPEELREPSAFVTPTLEHTRKTLVEGMSTGRTASFSDKVRARDDYTCVITGVIDKNAPPHIRSREGSHLKLDASHIFKHSVAVLRPRASGENRQHGLYVTYDILKHYCQLDDSFAENMKSQIDDPSNGMLLGKDLHSAFDDFAFCFVAHENANTYKIKHWVSENEISWVPMSSSVTFMDHSQDANNAALLRTSPHNHPQPETTIPLPSPQLLQLHAILAGVLNLSGAADMLQIFNDLPDFGGPAVCSGYGEDFMHQVIEYTGDDISRLREVAETTQRLSL
ncbi:hypothetical protein DENSPDRAFT_835743 [Dentipellis sp. KUC8613]|nr:hypothetical protein DENSPDRAFT_835743 [Dentipellis sp. KUC8613]